MSHQPGEFLGQTRIAGGEADGGIAGIGHEQELAAAGVVAVVVWQVECLAVDGDGEDIAEGEPGIRHVFLGDIQHGTVVLVIRRDGAFQQRLVDDEIVLKRTRGHQRHDPHEEYETFF